MGRVLHVQLKILTMPFGFVSFVLPFQMHLLLRLKRDVQKSAAQAMDVNWNKAYLKALDRVIIHFGGF